MDKFAVLVASAILMVAPLAVGADTTGNVHGVIVDRDSKAPIANVLLIMRSATAERRVRTDVHGYYAFWGLPPDRYALAAVRDGYNPRSGTLCVRADDEQYVRLELFSALGTFYAQSDYFTTRFQPDPSRTTDLYSLGACN